MTPLSLAGLHREVRSRLDGSLRRHALFQAGAGILLLLILAWFLVGPDGWEAGSPLPLILDGVALVALAALVRWFLRTRRRVLDERRISASMEKAAGVADGVLQGALELGRDVPRGVSGALVSRNEASLLHSLSPARDSLPGELGEALRRGGHRAMGALAVLAPLFALLFLLSPSRTASAWAGLVSPVRTFTGPVLPPLVLEPGDAEVQRGESVTVRVSAAFREEVTLYWQSAGDVARQVVLPVEGDSAVHLFTDLSAPTAYGVSAPDGARSPEYRLTPVDPLFVSDLAVQVEFPAYIGRPPEEFRGDVPALLLPVGTTLRFQGRASRPLSLAELLLAGETARELDVDGAAFQGSWTPLRDGIHDWRFLDRDGVPAALVPPPLELALVPDSAPRVTIALPAPDTLLPTSLKQPLVLEAGDDYGLRSLELVAWRVTALGDTLDPVSQTLDMGSARNALARPLLDVSRWGLVPGDQVRYFARVRDIHPSGQATRTAEYVLRMPTADELRRSAQEQLEDAAARLGRLQDEAARRAEETRNMERASRAPDRAGEEGRFGEEGDRTSFQEQEDLRQAVDGQQALLAETDSLGRELEALSEALKEAGASDPDLQGDLEELQDLLKEMGGPEMQERLQSILSEMDQTGRQDAARTLEELAQEQEAFREQLEEALERAQRAAVEQDFRGTSREAEELAEEQEALARSMAEEEDVDPRRAEQQEELARETEALRERMEALEERLQELGEQQAAIRMQDAGAAAESAGAEMQQAAREAREGSSQAPESAEDAAREMSEAAQAMRDAQQQMMAERAAAFREALEQTTQDALSLAREQVATREAMEGASGDRMAELRGNVAAVAQGVRNLAENLSMAARMAGADERELSARMGEAMEALSGTLEAMERPGGARPSPQAAAEQAVAQLNQVAQVAMAAVSAMQQGGQQGTASAEEMMEQLEEMAQQQADVNNQAAQMMPLELTPRTRQEQMQQMAQEQQQVASDLGDLSNQEGEEGPLGDLEALAREAMELAEELAGGRLDQETRERQERLFHRLLDAGRGLEREEESTERESEAAGVFERGMTPALDPGDLGLSRFRLPDAATLGRLPPAARALVLQYFQRLNQQGGGG